MLRKFFRYSLPLLPQSHSPQPFEQPRGIHSS
jgi:hypothetical protein